MIDVQNIKDCLIITSEEQKNYFINCGHLCFEQNIKFLTIQEIFDGLDYHYDERSLSFLLAKHPSLNYYTAEEFLSSLKFLKADFHNSKTEQLHIYQDELISEKLFYKDRYFLDLLRKSDIYIDSDVAIPSLIFNLNNEGLSYQILQNEHQNLNGLLVNNFSNIFDEVYYVLNYISKLIYEGSKPDDILIYGTSDEYYPYFKNLSPLFGFDIDYPNDQPLLSFPIANEILETLKTLSIKDTYDLFLAKQLNNLDKQLLNEIILLLSKYENSEISKEKILIFYKDLLENNYHHSAKLINCPHVINNLNYYPNSKVIAVNFCQGVYPTIYKDNELFSNDELKTMHCISIEEKNLLAKNRIIQLLSSDNLCFISHKEFGRDSNNYPSSLIEECKLKTINPSLQELQFSSKALNIYASSIFDYKRRYRFVHNDYLSLVKQVNIPYFSYSNKYKLVNVPTVLPLKISYSSANTFFECHYHYYLQNILFSYQQGDAFNAILGSLIHRCLELMYKDDFSIDNEFDNFININKLTDDQIMFLNRIKDDTKMLLEFISNKEKNYKIAPQISHEIKLDAKLNNNVYLSGRIDKLLKYRFEDKDYYAVVDYKSSDKDFHYGYLQFGLSLQLPTYLALLKLNYGDSANFIGVSYETILAKARDQLYFENNSYIKNFYLNGIFCDNIGVLRLIDPRLEDGNYVKGLKLGKNGFNKKTINAKKIVNANELNNFADVAIKKMLEASDEILSRNFDITPIELGSSIKSCQYCPYKDVCYVTNSDIKVIKIEGDEAEEGGEDD